MKKITLLLMTCCMSVMTFAAGGNITYVLNGGKTNDYGWQSKSDMFDAFMHEARPTGFEWNTLEYYMQQTDPLGAPNICSGLTSCVILNTNADQWGWLKTYIIDVTTAQRAVTPAPVPMPTALAAGDDLAGAAWRYAVGAFFANCQRTGWPASANFAEAGQPEAFLPAWGCAFAGPSSYDGTKEIVLPIPVKEGEFFLGWYDNPEFSGSKIKTIPVDAEGDKTFYAKFGEFTPGGDITYVLNGGVTNDYGWQSKSDMFDAFMHEARPTGFEWKSLEYYMQQTDPLGAPNICSGLTTCAILNTNADQWGWLKTYVIDVTTAQRAAIPAPTLMPTALAAGDDLAGAAWRYAVAAFFANFQRASYPVSATFAIAGLPEAFMPYWKQGFAGPDTYDGTKEIVLPTPYKEGQSFYGWYENATFAGSQIRSIPVGEGGDKTVYARFGEYLPTAKEVWDMAAATGTKTRGVVTYVKGTTAYIQDVTAGLMVEFTAAPTIAAGNEIIINGTTAAEDTYVKLTGATLVEKATATLPTAPKITLAALAANMYKYVTIEGLTITAIDGSNVTLSDGTNTAVLVVEGLTLPVKAKVSVTATVTGATKLAGYASNVIRSKAAAADPFNYPTMGDKGQYSLKSRWLISSKMENLSANSLGPDDNSRAMAAKNGKMYFPDKNNLQLLVVDGETGDKLDPIKFPTKVFEGAGLPFNDLKLDSKGNLVSTNLITSPSGRIQAWKLDVDKKDGTLIFQDSLVGHPDFADLTAARFDYFGVWGDVDKDAIMMSHCGSTMSVYKWTIKNGKAGEPEEIPVDNSTAGTFLTDMVAANTATAGQVVPINENLFYFDVNISLPTLIDMDGYVVDGFHNSTHADIKDKINTANIQGANGLTEFELGGEYFLVMGYTNWVGTPPAAFRLFKFKDEAREFKDIEPLWIFPDAGMGGITNGTRTMMPCVEVNEATKTATIYVYANNNGYGVYEFTIGAGTGIKPVNGDAINVFASGKQVLLSERAANLKVYNLAGQLLQNVQGVSSTTIANSGIYIVSVQTLKGEIVTKKVIIK